MLTLSSPFFKLTVHPDRPALTLIRQPAGFPRLERAQLSAGCRTAGRRFDPLREGWARAQPAGPRTQDGGPHGPGLGGEVCLAAGPSGLALALEFFLPSRYPLALWRICLRNEGSHAIQVDDLKLLEASPGSLSLGETPGAARFYSNGWQSWSVSGSYAAGDRARLSRLGPIQSPMCENHSTPNLRGRGQFASDFFGALIDTTQPQGLTVGFLSQKTTFGSLAADLRGAPGLRLSAACDGVRLDPGAELTSDWAVAAALERGAAQPLDPYLDAAAREHGLGEFPAGPTGWCSWYHYYTRVTAADIRRNLAAVTDLAQTLPLGLVQIDDGFESQVGDWFSFRSTFPDGVAPLAAQIQAAGLTPGLWLAPFILHPGARLIRQHPDWVLRGRAGRPVNAGFVWDRFTTALDLSHPAALEYASQVVEIAAQDWGFPFLKLDFLYAGALEGRRWDPTLTRAQVLRRGLESLRQAAGPQTFLLGCGAPLGSSLGLFEAMRVGPDVSGNWHPTHFNLSWPFRSEPGMPSARNALASVVSRAVQHRRWWINDPDCLPVRPESNLSLSEVHSLASVIALAGGSLLLSDDLAALPPERLRIAQVLLPAIDQRPRIPDLLEESIPARVRLDLSGPGGPWSLIARLNWADTPVELDLDLSEYGFGAVDGCGVEFWTQRVVRVEAGQPVVITIPAHGVAFIALRIANLDQQAACYLGSDLHISQGMELAEWDCQPGQVRLTLALPRRADGAVLLRLPDAPVLAELDGAPVQWQAVGQGVYRFPVEFEFQAALSIQY